MVWILTREINEYNQDGEYFVAVFKNKPHHTSLSKYGVAQTSLRHVMNGGGWRREDGDNEWYYLREMLEDEQ